MAAITVNVLLEMKKKGEKITCLTAYDYSFAALLDKADTDIILVGDSLGMVIQGRETTLGVSLQEAVYHTKCVSKGAKNALILADMPFGTFQSCPEAAFDNAVVLLADGGANMVKIEGGSVMSDTVSFLVSRGIPVCGHLGLTPQSVNQLGGYYAQGTDDVSAEKILNDAVCLADAGISLLILESMPARLAELITRKIDVPTIGIGAGPATDGQVLVLYDLLGIYPNGSPSFSKNFLQENETVLDAIIGFNNAVKKGLFPSKAHFT